jgi:uncharacterized protein (DUF169 family)
LDHLPLGVDHVDTSGRHCTFVGEARRGKIIWAEGEDITCPLARFNLGIDTPDEGTIDALARTIVSWGEATNIETAQRYIASLSPLPFGKRVFVYFPLSKMPFPPDLALFILHPNEAMEKLLTITQATGERCEGRVSGLGALCGECTALPLLSERAVLSPGCSGSRREAFLASDELFLSIPYLLYRSTIGS